MRSILTRLVLLAACATLVGVGYLLIFEPTDRQRILMLGFYPVDESDAYFVGELVVLDPAGRQIIDRPPRPCGVSLRSVAKEKAKQRVNEADFSTYLSEGVRQPHGETPSNPFEYIVTSVSTVDYLDTVFELGNGQGASCESSLQEDVASNCLLLVNQTLHEGERMVGISTTSHCQIVNFDDYAVRLNQLPTNFREAFGVGVLETFLARLRNGLGGLNYGHL